MRRLARPRHTGAREPSNLPALRETLSKVGYGPELLEDGHDEDAGPPVSWIASRHAYLRARLRGVEIAPQEREGLAAATGGPVASNKAAEMLRRVLPALEPDAVVGIVVPRQFLHAEADTAIRRALLERYQLLEICVHPDRIFHVADHECAVVLARGAPGGTRRDSTVVVRRVRESGLTRFRDLAEVSAEDRVPGAVFLDSDSANLLVPELRRVWIARA